MVENWRGGRCAQSWRQSMPLAVSPATSGLQLSIPHTIHSTTTTFSHTLPGNAYCTRPNAVLACFVFFFFFPVCFCTPADRQKNSHRIATHQPARGNHGGLEASVTTRRTAVLSDRTGDYLTPLISFPLDSRIHTPGTHFPKPRHGPQTVLDALAAHGDKRECPAASGQAGQVGDRLCKTGRPPRATRHHQQSRDTSTQTRRGAATGHDGTR